MQDQDIELHSQFPEEQLDFNFPGFGSIRIHRSHAGFWNQLMQLPAHIKMKMLKVSEQDADLYILAHRRELKDKILARFRHRGWRFKSEGNLVDFNDADLFSELFSCTLAKAAFLRKLRSNKCSITEMLEAIDVFDSGNEIYSKTFKRDI